MLCCQLLQLLACQDVRRRAVRVEERHLCGIIRIAQHGAQDLVARRQASAACNHGDALAASGLVVPEEIPLALVDELAQWSLHVDGVTNFHGLQVLRHLAALGERRVHACKVHLHQEVNVPKSLVIRHRSIWPHHGFAVHLGLEEDVHARRQAQAHGLRGQSEAEDARILGHDDLLHQGQLLRQPRVQEDLLWCLRAKQCSCKLRQPRPQDVQEGEGEEAKHCTHKVGQRWPHGHDCRGCCRV
mmetsp:Transcript_42329/g.76540  ORF Transcript_42329/g.76540 Transcript_42329/m.76540 type:complete len:243 (+) Transcript_42329:305-1033(+)